MKRKCKKLKSIVQFSIVLIYMFVVFVHVFIPHSGLNKVVSSKIFIAQFYAFPVLFGVVIAFVSFIILFAGLLRYKSTYLKKTSFKFWLSILVASIVFATGGMDSKVQADASKADETFRIVEWNTLDNLNANHIKMIFGKFDADIAVFPEFGGYEKGDRSNNRIRDLFEAANMNFDDYEIFVSQETNGGIAPVTIVIKKDFATYNNNKVTSMTTYGTVYLRSQNEDAPDIIGLHTAPPLPGLMWNWERDLELIANDIAFNNSNAIIIGDFNATTRHGAMNEISSHEDALSYLSKLDRGTWTSSLPSCFRTTIDHILLPKHKYVVKSIELKDFPESDHACVFAELSKRQ